MSRYLLAALFCALLPLVTGTAIFFAWLWLRWDGFEVAGMVTIFAGVVLFVVGGICLLVHNAKRGSSTPTGFWQSPKVSVVACLLLFLNFPVAAVYTTAAIDFKYRFYVTVQNAGNQQIESFVVTGGGVEIEFGPIAPNTTVRRSFNIAHEGELLFRTTSDGIESTGIVYEYIWETNLGGRRRVLINPDHTIEVTNDYGT